MYVCINNNGDVILLVSPVLAALTLSSNPIPLKKSVGCTKTSS